MTVIAFISPVLSFTHKKNIKHTRTHTHTHTHTHCLYPVHVLPFAASHFEKSAVKNPENLLKVSPT